MIYQFPDAKLREVGAVKEKYVGEVLSRTYRKHPIILSFATDSVNGVSFQFEGEYLDEPEEVNGQYIDLKGKLIRFLNGRKTAEALLKFTPNITE